jgi:hypothetical protein
MELNDFPFAKLLIDMADVETLSLPGPAKHHYVIASVVNTISTSPPPVLVWLIYLILNQAIPILLEWLKSKYGEAWPTDVKSAIAAGRLPWSNTSSPPIGADGAKPKPPKATA